MDLSNWKGAPSPERAVLSGRYARLEPLDPARHKADLLHSARQPGADDRFRYLSEELPAGEADFTPWIEKAAASDDPLFFAVIDRASGRAEGRQSFLRIAPAHGVIEIGHILWGPAMARTRVATEALYLSAAYVFDTLGYRRFEWKCNNLNEPSKRAAQRFGFTSEGVFRQHMVQKGRNRDTAWFAMTDGDWHTYLRAGYEAWLRPENFGPDGQQKAKLRF
jgi:RimJ/RimL family protein N-acetyltransferase